MKNIVFLICSVFLFAFSANAQQGPFRFPAHTSVKDFKPGTIVYKLKPTAIKAPIFGRNRTTIYSQPHILATLKATTPQEQFPHGLFPNTLANNPSLAQNELASNGSDKLSGIYTISVPLSIDIEQAITQLRQDPNVLYAEPIYTNFRPLKDKKRSNTRFLSPNDPLLANQYYLDKIKAKEAWDVQTGSTSLVIGVIDYGFAINVPAAHADLINNYNLAVDLGDYPSFDQNLTYSGASDTHGTEVLGLCSATPNNGINMAGIGYNCKYTAIKATNDAVTSFQGINSIIYAANPAQGNSKIINISWGRPGDPSQFEHDILRTLVELYDVVFVAAAGQDVVTFSTGTERYWYPASYSDVVLSVGGSNQTDEKPASFDWNEKVGITAPGTNIYTLTNSGFITNASGTSFSSPIVAGAAALVRSQYPSLKASQVIARLRAAANKDAIYTVAANNAYAEKMGSGLLDIHKALTDATPKFLSLESHAQASSAQAGTSSQIICGFKNQLTALTNLQVELSTSSSYVTITQNSSTIGAVATLGVTGNEASPFSFNIAANTPTDTKVLFTLTFKDNGTTLHTLSFYEVLNPGTASNKIVSLSINDLKLSMNDVGRLGVYDTPGSNYQLGFGLNYKGQTILDEAGLLIGTGNSNVSNSVKNAETGSAITRDTKFTTKQSSIQYTTSNDTLQDVSLAYEDITNNTERIKIEVSQRARAWKGTNKNQFIIVEYQIRNISGATINNLYAGIFADWGIGNYQSNSAVWEADSLFGYVHNGATYAGIKLLTNQAKTHYAIENSGSGLNISTDFTTAEKFTALSNTNLAGNNSVSNKDVSHVVGAHLSNVAHNETRLVAFAIMAADNLADLKTTSFNAKKQFQVAKTAPVPTIANVTACRGSSVTLSPSNGNKFDFYATSTLSPLLYSGRSLTLNNVTAADTFYIVNKDSLWVSTAKQVTISITGPTANFTLSQDTIQTNSNTVSVSESSNGATQWAWDFGNGQTFNGQAPGTQTYPTAGTYQVKLTTTAATGCTNSLIKPLVVLDCNSSTDAIVSRVDTLDIGTTDTLSFKNTAAGVTAYQWNFGNGNTSTEANPLQLFTSTGRYDISLTSTHANGCKTTVTKTLTVINSFTVGISQKLKQQIQLYPNPSKGNFQVDLPALPAKALLQLTTVQGQTIYTKQTTRRDAQTLNINLPQLASGIYILHIKWGDDFWVKRLIISND